MLDEAGAAGLPATQSTGRGGAGAINVRHFRQIVIWPLEIERAPRAGGNLPTEALFEKLAGQRWKLVEDEIGNPERPLDERHYREFVGFLPHVQRFLYGDTEGALSQLKPGEAPLRIYRRTDIAAARITLKPGEAPVTAQVSHVDLHFFHDCDVIILACELSLDNVPLAVAHDVMYRFGRAYPPGWSETGEPLHCPALVEWLDAAGTVLARSDFENRQRYMSAVGRTRLPCFASHWEYVLEPINAYGSAKTGPLSFRQVEYYRLPQMVFLTLPRLSDLDRSDFVRLTFATGAERALPYSERYLAEF